jgi:hypothetical protein
MFKTRKEVRRLAVVPVVAIVAMAAFGFAASNTVDPSNAGDGSAAISGYTVSAVTYTLGANPQNLANVKFQLAPAGATSVQASVTGAAPYTACTGPVAGVWTCNVTDAVTAATSLRVVAAQ